MAREIPPRSPVVDPTDPRPAPVDLEDLRRFVNSDNRFHGVDHLQGETRDRWFAAVLPAYDPETVDDAGWDRLVELRDRVRAFLAGEDDGAVLSELARAYPARLDLAGGTWAPVTDSTEHRLAVDVLGSLQRAVADGRISRLRLCRRPDCGWCYYDGSKNRSARWCSADPCGDVMKTRAYRARNRAGTPST
ncbi:MAG TPA: CGNR zinc finger domain-containing protein [Nocardioides sp.]|nr:CGNR zinc finger domain-containing protein [Nocardioides sp.]